MNDKSNMLGDILDTLNEEDATMIEKTAETFAGGMKTENKEACKKAPVDASTSVEKKLKVGGLSGLQKEMFHEVPSVPGPKSDGGTTENEGQKPKKVEAGLTFEKKASADILETLLESAGIDGADLDKTASAEETDGLLKIAHDTINEMNDLEKVADDMAERAATKFMAIISEKM